MKKLLYFTSFISLLFFDSCNSEEIIRDEPSINFANQEIAFPDSPKEIITLKNGIVLEKVDSLYIYGGDMILTQEDINILLNENQTRSAIMKDRTWKSGLIGYVFDPKISQATRENTILAMNTWTSATKGIIRFVELKDIKFSDKLMGYGYLRIFNGDGNYSHVGRKANQQDLSLSSTGSNAGTAMHELGHAIGLIHEQCRHDRDNYILIDINNVKSDKRQNYDKDIFAVVVKSSTEPFDFNSIMLYSSYNEFAINPNKPTMMKKDGSTWTAQRSYISESNIAAVYIAYGFPK